MIHSQHANSAYPSSSNHQFPNEYEYPVAPGISSSIRNENIRPTIDVYHSNMSHQPYPQSTSQEQHHEYHPYHPYEQSSHRSNHEENSQHHQPAHMHQPHPQYFPPQSGQQHNFRSHGGPSHGMPGYGSTPPMLLSGSSRSSSLKRKGSGCSTGTTMSLPSPAGPSMSPSSHDKLCDICLHPDPVLLSSRCGHVFHSRCVHRWPMIRCPVCDMDCNKVSILQIDLSAETETRSGKWTRAEEKFIDIILAEFDRNCFPLANGTPVRLILAKLLNCSTMRLSKKFQKNALGKRTFRIPKPAKGEVAMEFYKDDHLVRQKEFSRLETIFRHELVEQFRRDNNTDEDAYLETRNLRLAVKQFWVINFLKFAVVIGQPVAGMDISDSKKKKEVLQLLRSGRYDDIFSWNNSSEGSLPLRPPMANGMPMDDHLSHQWTERNYPAPCDSMMNVPSSQPMKRMRTPDVGSRHNEHGEGESANYDLHPMSSFSYHNSKSGPSHGQSPHHGHQGNYSSTQYPHSINDEAYGNYGNTKLEKRYGYPDSSHRGGLTAPPLPYGQTAPHYVERNTHSIQNGYRDNSSFVSESSSYDSSPEAPVHNGPSPWDELLDDISEGHPQVVDPSLQAWSNLHIM